MAKSDQRLKQRRTRFVKEYLIDQNATRAAVAAGYSENGAHVAGNRLLRDAKVQSEIANEQNKIYQKLDISIERVNLELARLAYFDPRKFYNPDGSAKSVTELDEDTARALAGFDMAELFTGNGEDRGLAGYVKKFKLADKTKALELLGRHLKMFTDRVELSGDEEILKALDEGRRRAASR